MIFHYKWLLFSSTCLSELAFILNLKIQIYKEHKLYVQSWRKRKRMVGHWFISLVMFLIIWVNCHYYVLLIVYFVLQFCTFSSSGN